MEKIDRALALFGECVALETADYTSTMLLVKQQDLQTVYEDFNEKEKSEFEKQAAEKYPGTTLAENVHNN